MQNCCIKEHYRIFKLFKNECPTADLWSKNIYYCCLWFFVILIFPRTTFPFCAAPFLLFKGSKCFHYPYLYKGPLHLLNCGILPKPHHFLCTQRTHPRINYEKLILKKNGKFLQNNFSFFWLFGNAISPSVLFTLHNTTPPPHTDIHLSWCSPVVCRGNKKNNKVITKILFFILFLILLLSSFSFSFAPFFLYIFILYIYFLIWIAPLRTK